MTECERIRDQIDRVYRSDAWHGPAVLETLEGVDAATAHRRVLAQAHTIAEIVLHIAAWKDIVRRRIGGEAFEVTTEMDWPKPADGETGLRSALETLDTAHRSLIQAVEALTDDQLDSAPPNSRRTTYVLLHGVTQHDAYHAGQIALLRKAGAAR